MCPIFQLLFGFCFISNRKRNEEKTVVRKARVEVGGNSNNFVLFSSTASDLTYNWKSFSKFQGEYKKKRTIFAELESILIHLAHSS